MTSESRAHQDHRERRGDYDIASYRGSDPSDDHAVEVPELCNVSDLYG